MSDAALAQRMLHEAFPAHDGINTKARIAVATRALRLPFRRVKALWYGEARRIEFHEMEAIQNAKAAALAARVSRLRASLAATDPEFFEPDIAALERIERQARRFAETHEQKEKEQCV